MKIHNVFNSSGNFLASFASIAELNKYIRRHCRDADDTTIVSVVVDSWNEFPEDVVDSTRELIDAAWEEGREEYESQKSI